MSTIYDVKTRSWTAAPIPVIPLGVVPVYRIPIESELVSPRVTYYTSDVDPRIHKDKKKKYDYSSSKLTEGTEENPANLISSLCEDGKHRMVLDCDVTDIDLRDLKSYYHVIFKNRDGITAENSLKAEKALAETLIVRSSSHLHVYSPIEFSSWQSMTYSMNPDLKLGITQDWSNMVKIQRQALLRLPMVS